uniref:Uncharacterized protein n=1 Tax=Siphoviridae sp. ct2vX3 TaxID=2825318 RepID=A0A8S5PYJ9_9CAUD|nr:MAG TPA: hypothetical protein [Siphoviridae sp. ct2vX3]
MEIGSLLDLVGMDSIDDFTVLDTWAITRI